MRQTDHFDEYAATLVFYNEEFRVALEAGDDERLSIRIAEWAREHWGTAIEPRGAPSCDHKTIVGGNDCRWCADCGTDFKPHVEGLEPQGAPPAKCNCGRNYEPCPLHDR